MQPRKTFRSNMWFGVKNRTAIEKDLEHIIKDLKMNSVKANRILIDCQSFKLYAHFLYELGDYSYYPPGAEKIASNRLFS